MNAFTIKLVKDDATPAIAALVAGLTPARLAARIGPPLKKLTMVHLAGLGGNAKGYPSTRFYEKFARNVRWLPSGNGVSVAILPAVINGRQVGLGLRVFGGTIVPVTAEALAIPISPVSYGHVPSDFPGLFLLKTAKGAFLVQKFDQKNAATGRKVGKRGLGGNAGRRLKAELNFLFKLTGKVVQAGDRTVLPSDDEYRDLAISTLQLHN